MSAASCAYEIKKKKKQDSPEKNDGQFPSKNKK